MAQKAEQQFYEVTLKADGPESVQVSAGPFSIRLERGVPVIVGEQELQLLRSWGHPITKKPLSREAAKKAAKAPAGAKE